MEVLDHRFRVMASETQITLVGPAADAQIVAERRLRELEARWSRFRADSELTRLNETSDDWLAVSADTITLIDTMQHAARATAGRYDPTMLHEILDAGYTASIDDPPTVAPVGSIEMVAVSIGLPCGGLTVLDVEVDADSGRVFVPAGLALDPGGIGKGLAADLVVTELLRSGTLGALVGIGGDIAAAGSAPTPDGWIVEVDDPFAPGRPVATLALSAGGVATSSTVSRRWMHRGTSRHHVLDPATGRSSSTDLATVTVVATAGWLAEVHATTALLRGSAHALSYLESCDLSGLATTLDATTTMTADLAGSAAVATAPGRTRSVGAAS